MGIRFVEPSSVRRELASGGWVELKAELSVQEMRAIAAAQRRDPFDSIGIATEKIAAWLLAWSVPVRIETSAEKRDAVGSLCGESFGEILEAVNVQEAEAEKNGRSSPDAATPAPMASGTEPAATSSDPISPSVV